MLKVQSSVAGDLGSNLTSAMDSLWMSHLISLCLRFHTYLTCGVVKVNYLRLYFSNKLMVECVCVCMWGAMSREGAAIPTAAPAGILPTANGIQTADIPPICFKAQRGWLWAAIIPGDHVLKRASNH